MSPKGRMIWALCLVGALSLWADGSAWNVDGEIEKIKNAPAAERREMMNRFKERLATMNEAQRREAIAKLRGESGRTAADMEGVRSHREATRMQRMEERERMGQRHGVEQFMRTDPGAHPSPMSSGHGGGNGGNVPSMLFGNRP